MTVGARPRTKLRQWSSVQRQRAKQWLSRPRKWKYCRVFCFASMSIHNYSFELLHRTSRCAITCNSDCKGMLLCKQCTTRFLFHNISSRGYCVRRRHLHRTWFLYDFMSVSATVHRSQQHKNVASSGWMGHDRDEKGWSEDVQYTMCTKVQ